MGGRVQTQHTVVIATLHNSQTADYIATLVTLDGPNEDFVHDTKSAKMDHPLSPAYGLAFHPPLTPHVSGRVQALILWTTTYFSMSHPPHILWWCVFTMPLNAPSRLPMSSLPQTGVQGT